MFFLTEYKSVEIWLRYKHFSDFPNSKIIAINKLFTYYVIHIKGRRGKAKYNECIIDGGGGLKTV